jgi:hypothetical protein
MLVARGEGLWTLDHRLRVRGLDIGTRTTVMRDGAGALVLHSPGPLDDAATAAIAALGSVGTILGPNLEHHLSLAAARARFAGARLYAPASLLRKRPDLPVAVQLPMDEAAANAALPPELRAILTAFPVAGMPKLDEIAWLHRPSRTLVLTDLAFNIRAPKPWFTRTFMRCNGGFDRFGPTRILRALIKDRAATRQGIARLLEHDFGRVIVAHGDVFEGDGRTALRREYDFLVGDYNAERIRAA